MVDRDFRVGGIGFTDQAKTVIERIRHVAMKINAHNQKRKLLSGLACSGRFSAGLSPGLALAGAAGSAAG